MMRNIKSSIIRNFIYKDELRDVYMVERGRPKETHD